MKESFEIFNCSTVRDNLICCSLNHFQSQQLQSPSQKRKEVDLEADMGFRRKKIKQEDNPDSGSSSPLPSPAVRDPEKWNPARLTQETLFIMGSHAHKVIISKFICLISQQFNLYFFEE